MKAFKIIYWISTAIVSVMMYFSVYAYFTSADVKGAFVHLGFPDWFRIELAIAKFLGATVLLVPMVPPRVKEWAYAGFFINFFSASLAHYLTGDPVANSVAPLVMLTLLMTSNIFFHKLNDRKTATA